MWFLSGGTTHIIGLTKEPAFEKRCNLGQIAHDEGLWNSNTPLQGIFSV
jgi:hypothetical protein